jgi:hypothetical protein
MVRSWRRDPAPLRRVDRVSVDDGVSVFGFSFLVFRFWFFVFGFWFFVLGSWFQFWFLLRNQISKRNREPKTANYDPKPKTQDPKRTRNSLF